MTTTSVIASSEQRMVLGLGLTGCSVARWWRQQGVPFIAADTRIDREKNPVVLDAIGPQCPSFFGDIDLSLVEGLSELVVSPGIPLTHPFVAKALDAGVRVIGDIDLFVANAVAPVVGITGSNGKSTVTGMVAAMLEGCGKRVVTGGNYGTPALDLLASAPDVYVLELSSFQLERAESLGLAVATVLNVSPDHLDRHSTMARYHQAKHRIFRGAKSVVANRGDPLTLPLLEEQIPVVLWRQGEPDLKEIGLRVVNGEPWVSLGFKAVFPASELPLPGQHNLNNALAALAIGVALGIQIEQLLPGLIAFKGLPHRCEVVGEANSVLWVNDSKGTNVGAAEAALRGIGGDQNVILIVGGVGKDQDFTPLRSAVEQHCRRVLTMGEAARELELALGNITPTQRVPDLSEAIDRAGQLARPGDIVLLSPACASFDMFIDFQARGDCFKSLVQQHLATIGAAQ